MFASVTRLRIRRFYFLPAFLWYTLRVQRQAEQAPGFHGGRLLVDAHSTYWTLTVWASERTMKAFRGASAHGKVMTKLARWCDEAAYSHWELQESVVPAWAEACQRLFDAPRFSRVNQPSAAHLAHQFATPRLSPLIGREMKPAASPEPAPAERKSA